MISPPVKLKPEDLIFFENEDYIIAKKPFGLLSEEDPAGSVNLRKLLEDYLHECYPKKKQLICQLANRLDKPVGGLLFCAKKQSILKDLQEKFFKRKISKYYLAVVEGVPKKPKAFLENYLVKSSSEFRAIAASPDTPGVKLARLRYELISTQDNYSLLKIQIFTGKFHQIRFQLSSLGHPIWNDEWYGAKRMDPRIHIGLYSYFLGFDDTKTGIRKEYQCLPDLIEPWNLFQSEWIALLEKVTESN
ncbi:MAG: RNA pseudouridine synthase [Saprospiraceae bacterium]|nr:RNA pseudouridine synthase [Saprospiraceae bacterium]MBK7737319.1 RNA pseudouridine synthase [Saprospiraceae bacterium]MBK7914087.1 RNA pseudouridine synthase [Saprospiraceae bacterium]